MRTPRIDSTDRPVGRRGTILVLAAFLLIVLMGVVALVVDIGVLAAARAQLETVADAAALAGARQLVSERRLSTTISDLAPEIQAANDQAIAFGQANSVLNQPAVIQSGDIKVGYKTSPDPTDSTFTTGGSPLLFNSVEVTATRSSDHVGIVPAFFGQVLGYRGTSISVTSTATVEVYQIKGFSATGGQNAGILPFALDRATWDARNTNPVDQYHYDAASGSVTSGPDGVNEVALYADENGPVNFGTINVGTDNHGVSNLTRQIFQGVSSSEMNTEFGNTTAPLPHGFSGNPGVSSAIEPDLAAIIGQPRAIVLYDATNGNPGTASRYEGVSFAPIRIVAVDLTGNPKQVIVQPANLTDPTAIPDYRKPGSWTSGGVVILHLSR